MRAYISNQVKMHTYHLKFEILNNVFYKDSQEKSPMGSLKRKATLKWPKTKNAYENFSLLRFFRPEQTAHEN
jgi:hypothetical protein